MQYELLSLLKPSEGIAAEILAAARGLFRAGALLALGFTGIRQLLLARAGDPFGKLAQALVCFALVEHYDFLFRLVVETGDALCTFLREEAGYKALWTGFLDSLWQLWREGSYLEFVSGIQKGTALAFGVTSAYSFAWWASWIVRAFAAVYLNILYALGPLWVVAGLIGNGEHLCAFAGSVTRALLWPVYPCIVMLVLSKGGLADIEIARDNVSLAFVLTLTLAASSILSPWVVSRMFRQGPGGLGALVFGVSIAALGRVLATVAVGRGIGAMASGVGASAGSIGATTTPALASEACDYHAPAPAQAEAAQPLPPPRGFEQQLAEQGEVILYDQPGMPILRTPEKHALGQRWLKAIREDLERR